MAFRRKKLTQSVKAPGWTVRGSPEYNTAMKAKDLVIYTDMDGTVLTDWSMGPVVPERNLELIKKFVEEGGSFSVASGRQGPGILPFFPDIRFTAPLVCGNGAVLYDAAAGRPLRKVNLPQAYKLECLDYFLAHPDVWIVAADDEAIWQISSGDQSKDARLDDWVRPWMSIDDFLERDFVKVCYVTAAGGSVETLRAEVDRFDTAGLVVGAQSGPRYLEMVERSVNKGDGIRRALELAGLQDRTLVCIGDYFNDWAMLKAADIAACPENSHQGIKDICRIVTCGNNEGAVADLIERLYLL